MSLSAAPPQSAASGPQTGPKIWLNEAQGVPANHVGTLAATGPLVAGQAAPLSVTSADANEDGVADLLVGYSTPGGGVIAVHRGNLAAFAPQGNTALMAIGAGQFPSPFLPDVQVFKVPVTPDLVAVGNFTGNGHMDLAVAARGGSSLYLLAGDGAGNFAAPQAIPVQGTMTTLAAGALGRPQQFTSLMAGITDPQTGSSLQVLQGTQQGMVSLASYPMSSPVTAVAFGDLDGDGIPDAAVLAGGQVNILRASSMKMEAVSLPVSAVSMALGSFIHDRDPRVQMALLTSDGTVHIAVHNSFDARPFTADEIQVMRHAAVTGQPNPLAAPPLANAGLTSEGWKVVESFASAAPITAGQAPVMFSTRVSSNAADDVMVLNAGLAQMAVISHPNLPDGAATFVPGQLSTRPYSGAPVAAVAARVNIDGRPGVVAVQQGQIGPSVMMPLPDPTFTVNTTADGVHPGACAAATANQCTLREAIIEANAAAGVDTIIVPAGTYTLTIANASSTVGENAAATGDLDITDGVNIQGAGSATTIVQAGTTNANGIDKVFSINPLFNKAFDTSISGLTIRFGRNQTSFATDGFSGGFDWEASGTGTLTVTDVIVTDNTTADGDGAGITLTNTNGGTGHATISNSIIQNNTVNEATTGNSGLGGGIFAGTHTSFTVTNTSILNNHATQNVGAAGSGGGVYIFGPSGGGGQTAFHNVTISGNQSALNGGGIHTGAGILIDTGSVISGNTSVDGAGLWSSVTAETTTVSKSTITGNTATGNGGGIRVDNSTPNNFNMSFSRIAGNAAAAGSALSNGTGTVTATNNWWGTNTPAGVITAGSPAAVFDPFIVLTHTASPATIRINQSTTLTGSLAQDNHGTAIAAANLNVLIGLPITFDNAVDGTIPQAQPESIGAAGTATATFNAGGVAGGGKADATVDQATVTASIVVLEPLQITKSFNPATVAVNASSTLTFSVKNPNVVAVDANFTDTFPAGLVVAATPGVTNTCGGTVTAVASAGSVTFTNAALAVGSCTITVNVAAAVDNVYSNSVTINSTAAGTGAQSTSTASLTVINPPAISKVFGAATIPLNGSTSLTFTLTSTNANLTLNGVAFTDSLPPGLVVATPSNLSTTCSGTATAANGSSSISLSGASLAPAASCTVSVNVTGTTPDVKNNSVQVTSANGGTGNTSNASITVVAPPVIIKAFGAVSIPLNGSTSLTFTIQNNNVTTTLTGVGFSDTLPAGLVVSTPNGLTGTCGGGTITATQATNVISLAGATLAQSSSCTFSVNVTGTAAGTQNNTTGNVTSTEGGTGGTASTSIKVVAPPSIAKAFGAAAVPLNGSTSLTFTITNPAANTVAEAGVAFTDTLPAGIVVATPNNGLTNTCGGTPSAVAGSGSVSLTGGTIAVTSSCTVTVNVTVTATGNFINTTGNVSSTNGGTGNTATATISVATPPAITKAFGAASIPLNGSTSLTFNITNPVANTIPLTGVAFTDSLPPGLVVATPNGLTSTCGGTATAVAGASSVSLSAGTLAVNTSCTLSVNVNGTTANVKNNSVQVTSTEGGVGNTSNASITVVAPPVIIKAFGAASIPLNGSTSLTFTIQNNNTTTTLTGVGFSDTLPAGLVVSTPNGLTGTCGGGTITATQATSVISLTGASLAASTSCTFSVNVTGTTAGAKNNTTGNVTSTEGGTGGTASTSITVVAPPAIAKAFSPTAIAVNGTSTLTLTITNPAANTAAEAGVAFSDTLPAGMVVATPNGLTNTCGGTATATAGSGSISLTGGSIATTSTCAVTVNVTASSTGTFTNTTGAVSSTNGGTGNTATASLTVQPADLTITKTHTGTFSRGQTGANWTITVTNSGAGPTVGTVTVVDTLPNVNNPPVPTAMSGTGWTCTLGTLTCTRSDVLAPGASYPAITLTVNIPINIQNNFTNTATVSGGGETNTGNDTATDPISLGPPIIIKPHAGNTMTITAGSSGTIAFDVTVSDPTLGAVGFTCIGLPAGAACTFTPGAANVGTTLVTMTITTSGKSSGIVVSSRNIDWTPTAPFYALLFPAVGIVIATSSAKKDGRRNLRGMAVCAVMMFLLVLAGCGTSTHPLVTPPGTYQINVTAVTPTLQVSTPVTLTVQ